MDALVCLLALFSLRSASSFFPEAAGWSSRVPIVCPEKQERASFLPLSLALLPRNTFSSISVCAKAKRSVVNMNLLARFERVLHDSGKICGASYVAS